MSALATRRLGTQRASGLRAMNPRQKENVARDLHRAKTVLLDEIAQNDAHLRAIAAEREAEFEERAQEALTESVLVRLSAKEKTAVAEIEHALDRLVAGEYGRCEECDEPIPRERLRILPSTRLCVDCKRAEEMETQSRARPEPQRVPLFATVNEPEE